MLCAWRCAEGQLISGEVEKPWQSRSGFASTQGQAAEQDRRTQIEIDRQYTLSELVDLAERHNSSTRAASAQRTLAQALSSDVAAMTTVLTQLANLRIAAAIYYSPHRERPIYEPHPKIFVALHRFCCAIFSTYFRVDRM